MLVIVNVVLGVALVIAPVQIAPFQWVSGPAGRVLRFMPVANFLNFVVASVFVVLALFVLIHLLLWDLVERFAYAFERGGWSHTRKFIGTIGAALLAKCGWDAGVLKWVGELLK
jgi:hypothetical protein